MSNWGFDEWIQIVQICIGIVTSVAIAGWVIWQYKKDSETTALRNERDRLKRNYECEIKAMQLYEEAIVRKLCGENKIEFPKTVKRPQGFQTALRNLARNEHHSEDFLNAEKCKFPENPYIKRLH